MSAYGFGLLLAGANSCGSCPLSPGEHWFWWLMTMACVVWYSAVTGYVAVRGGMDIKTMLRHLSTLDTTPDDK